MRILLLDNYDSFTYNIVERLRSLGYTEVEHRYNDAFDIQEAFNFEAIILSPGPGIPQEAGCLLPLIRHLYPHRPILGICLGHQAIAEAFGGSLVNLPQPYHGIASNLLVSNAHDPLLGALHQTPVGRYHSWVVNEVGLPSCLQITARSDEGHIMAIQHQRLPVYGVQFHPESYMSTHGDDVFDRFLTPGNR